MLTIDDFMQPNGELTESLFPGVNLYEALLAWIADASTRTESLPAQRAWVRYRAYSVIADRFHAGLGSESKGNASASLDPQQFRYWSRKAQENHAAFRSIASVTSAVTTVVPVW